MAFDATTNFGYGSERHLTSTERQAGKIIS
jgi:hypothetical protein